MVELSPTALYDLGFEAAIEILAEQFSTEHKLKISFENSDEPKPLTDEAKILLYRSVRELLVNIVKHAEAKTVQVTLATADNNLVISIKDDGKGFDPLSLDDKAAKSKSLGLFSIRERLMQLGGCMDIVSQPDKGTAVTITAPLTTNL